MLAFEGVPQKGFIYATFVDEIVSKRYSDLSEIEEYLAKDNFLEIHLFDAQKEVRFVRTAGKGVVRVVVSAEDESQYDDRYCEQAYWTENHVDKHDKLSDKIEVVNYINYDENDMIQIVNYRLKEVE